MEFCPSPDRPAIVPDEESLKHRRRLRYVIYFNLYMMFSKFLVMSPISGIFQIFSIYIAFSSWATMHHCNLIFQQIFTIIDFVIILSSWGQLQAMLASSLPLLFLFYGMSIVLSVSIFIQFQAYMCFKAKFNQQHHGGAPQQDGYRILGNGGVRGMSRYDDPEQRPGTGGAGGSSGYLVSGPTVNQRQPLNIQGPATGQSTGRSYQAFAGQGVRVG